MERLAAAVVLLGAYVLILSSRNDDGASTYSQTSATPLLGSNGIANSPVSAPTVRDAAPASNVPAVASNVVNTGPPAFVPPMNAPANTVGGDRATRFDRSYSGTVGDGGVTMRT